MCNSTTCGNAYLGGFSFPTRFLSIWQTMGRVTRCFELRVGFPVSKDGKTWWNTLGELADLAIDQPPLNQTLMRRTCSEPQIHRRYCRGRRRPALREGGSSAEQYLVWQNLEERVQLLVHPGVMRPTPDMLVAMRTLGCLLAHELVSKNKGSRSSRTSSMCARALGDGGFSSRLPSTRPTSYMRAMRTQIRSRGRSKSNECGKMRGGTLQESEHVKGKSQ